MVTDVFAELFVDLVVTLSIVCLRPVDTVLCAEFVGLDKAADSYTPDSIAE